MTIPSRSPAPSTVTGLKHDLLVRLLHAWAPPALQRSRRITYAHGYADLDDAGAAEVALRTLAEQPGLVRGREIVMVAVADDPAAPSRRLAAVQRETPASAALVVHTVPGGTDARLGVALKAAGATRTPLFGYLDASGSAEPPALATVAALTIGKPSEVLLVLAATGAAPEHGMPLLEGSGSALRSAGFPLVCAVQVEADGDDGGEVLVFATTSGRSLETYKEALWAAGGTAGVRYRDPAGPRGSAVDAVPAPDLAPLRRILSERLSTRASATVTDLRTFVATETVYRAADATRALTDLLADGLLRRSPEHGRLGGDVAIARAEPTAVDG